MAKVNPKEYGPKYPGIPAAVTTADATVMQIRSSEDITLRGRSQRVLEFRQVPGHYLYPTMEEVTTLCEKISDDDDAWIGADVPLVKEQVFSKRQGKKVPVWRVAKLAEWDALIAEAAKAKQTENRAQGARARK